MVNLGVRLLFDAPSVVSFSRPSGGLQATGLKQLGLPKFIAD